MSRIPLPLSSSTPAWSAPTRRYAQQVFAQAAGLVGLLRLRVAFHNQCRSWMAIRYSSGLEDGVTEGLVCSLENSKSRRKRRPDQAEKAALASPTSWPPTACRSPTRPLTSCASTRRGRGDGDCLQVGCFVGFGRVAASLAMTDDLPEEYADIGAQLAPWRNAPASLV